MAYKCLAMNLPHPQSHFPWPILCPYGLPLLYMFQLSCPVVCGKSSGTVLWGLKKIFCLACLIWTYNRIGKAPASHKSSKPPQVMLDFADGARRFPDAPLVSATHYNGSCSLQTGVGAVSARNTFKATRRLLERS